ncbi:hypothetical protein [Occallatibacter savannae]|uniref:hypothetical protein n=1 Tax=Occallatibacter savannae TaxID=1002691 RepID=UPI0013A57AB9|nr:hypothetical protein [Occallatibacter savannae]
MRKRIYRDFPLFTAYQVWIFALAMGSTVASARLANDAYNRLFFISSVVDALFLFVILVEMSMSVLKPVRAMLPRWTIVAVAAALGAVAVAVWRIASPPGAGKLSSMSQHIIHLDITMSVLRIAFFVTLAALSQLLCLGWRDRVVQISTGLGFFSLVSLGVTFLHMNQGVGAVHLNELYHVLDRVVVCAYIASMLYWGVCFARDVRERQEFTPQMQKFIEALAQNARSTQLAMRSTDAKRGESY